MKEYNWLAERLDSEDGDDFANVPYFSESLLASDLFC